MQRPLKLLAAASTYFGGLVAFKRDIQIKSDLY